MDAPSSWLTWKPSATRRSFCNSLSRKGFAMRIDWDLFDEDRSCFADPGGRSALRRSSRRNPRNLPCPTCGRKNVLTPADVARGYQCDRCADAEEGIF